MRSYFVLYLVQMLKMNGKKETKREYKERIRIEIESVRIQKRNGIYYLWKKETTTTENDNNICNYTQRELNNDTQKKRMNILLRSVSTQHNCP